MSKHDKEEHGKTVHDPKHVQPNPVVPGSKEDKDNLRHEEESTRTEHQRIETGTGVDERTDGQRQRDEQLRTGGQPAALQPAQGGLTEEQQKAVKPFTPPDSPLVVPTNNADPPVTVTPWNPPQGAAAPQQNQDVQKTAEQYKRPQDEAEERRQEQQKQDEKNKNT